MKTWLKVILIFIASFAFFGLAAIGSPCDTSGSVECYVSQSVIWGLSLLFFFLLIYLELFFKRSFREKQKY